MAVNKCPRCKCLFRVPDDEWGEHDCPRCRYHPEDEVRDELEEPVPGLAVIDDEKTG
jgi:hypothetical protein